MLSQSSTRSGTWVIDLPRRRQFLEDIRNVKFAARRNGGPNLYVALKAIADISLETGASFDYRGQSQRCVSAVIRFVSLFGVAVMDGILNITYWRELSELGMRFAEAVAYAAEQRIRPMLKMALSAGVELLPASHAIG